MNNESIEIPSYLILWEGFTLVVLVTYMVKKNAILRGATQSAGKHKVIDFGDHYAAFDETTGECVDKGPGPGSFFQRTFGGRENAPSRNTSGNAFTVTQVSDPINIPLDYKIEDRPDGRTFIVKDLGTGEIQIYYSLDQIPPFHYDTFARMLRETGQWEEPPEDPSQDGYSYSD